MRTMQLNNLVLKIRRLIRSKLEIFQIISPHTFGIVISQFRLHQVRTEKCMRDEGAWQPIVQNIISDLQTQLVPRYILLQLCRVGRIEFYLEIKLPRFGWKGDLSEFFKTVFSCTFHKFRDSFVQIQPVTGIVSVGVGEAEVVLFDEVDGLTYFV